MCLVLVLVKPTQDGGEGGEGTITRVDLPGIVEVQWDATGITPSYDLGSSISSDALRVSRCPS